MREHIYTQAQCDGMSELEKAKAVAEKLGFDVHLCSDGGYGYCPRNSGGIVSVLDQCNSPNDIMPIGFKHEISLIKDGRAWVGLAVTHIGQGCEISADICAYSDDPLTAIVDCFLQMDISNA